MGLNDKVLFVGFVPREEVFAWITLANVTIAPYGWGFSNLLTTPGKIFEYMAFGKPIIATNFPGVSEVIKHESNGLLYSVGSLEDFKGCLLRMLENVSWAEKLGIQAQKDFEGKYSFDLNQRKLISLYDELLDFVSVGV